jgi:hypothetical protein
MIASASSTRSRSETKKRWRERRPLPADAVAQSIDVVEAVRDDLHERTSDVAAVEPDATQQVSRRRTDPPMQVVLGAHPGQVDVIGE